MVSTTSSVIVVQSTLPCLRDKCRLKICQFAERDAISSYQHAPFDLSRFILTSFHPPPDISVVAPPRIYLAILCEASPRIAQIEQQASSFRTANWA